MLPKVWLISNIQHYPQHLTQMSHFILLLPISIQSIYFTQPNIIRQMKTQTSFFFLLLLPKILNVFKSVGLDPIILFGLFHVDFEIIYYLRLDFYVIQIRLFLLLDILITKDQKLISSKQMKKKTNKPTNSDRYRQKLRSCKKQQKPKKNFQTNVQAILLSLKSRQQCKTLKFERQKEVKQSWQQNTSKQKKRIKKNSKKKVMTRLLQLKSQQGVIQKKNSEKVQKRKKQSPSLIVQEIREKLRQVFQETAESKYFSKKIYTKIMEGNDFPILNLKQDQKKSLQCNLIYNILRYLNWTQICSFLKSHRTKVKVLKVSTFKEYILNGKLFESEKQKSKYEVTSSMMQSAHTKLQDQNALCKNLLEKRFYFKIFEENPELYKQKMIVLVYKIMQFKSLITKQYKDIISTKISDFDIDVYQILEENDQRIKDGHMLQWGNDTKDDNSWKSKNEDKNYVEEQEEDSERGSIHLSCYSWLQDKEYERKEEQDQKMVDIENYEEYLKVDKKSSICKDIYEKNIRVQNVYSQDGE